MSPLRFGVFELDPRALELRRSGRRVRIAPQPGKALVYLASRTGKVVTKDELAAHLWGPGTHVDAEAGLHTVIKQVRRALGDRSQGARYLETLPRRGYRFVAPVERLADSPPPPTTHRAWVVTATTAAAAVVVGLAAGWWLARPQLSIASPSTVDATFKGRYILAQRQPDSGQRAAQMFERALDLDPRDVEALIGRGQSQLRRVHEGTLERRAGLEEARRAADAALKLDPRNGEALALRALTLWFLDWDWAAAGCAFDQAVELAPRNAELRHKRAFFFSASGRHEQALAEIARARALAPTSPKINLDVAWYFFYAGRFEEAVAEGLKALELSPGFFSAHHCLAESFRALGRSAEALEHLTAMTAAAGADEGTLEDLKKLSPEERKTGIRNWWHENGLEGSPTPAYHRAIMEVRQGNVDEAVRYLEKSARSLDGITAMAAVDPRLAPLRGQPGFQRFLADIRRRPDDPSPTR